MIALLQLFVDRASEGILKIGQRMAKIQTVVWRLLYVFDSRCSSCYNVYCKLTCGSTQ